VVKFLDSATPGPGTDPVSGKTLLKGINETKGASCIGTNWDCFSGSYIEVASSGAGYISIVTSMVNKLFYYQSATFYHTVVKNGSFNMVSPTFMPAHMGQHGVEVIRGAYPAGIIHQGPDAKPDLEMAVMHFKVLPGTSGQGSEFWIENYSGFTSIGCGWTNGTLTPSGYTTLGGSDDDLAYNLTISGDPIVVSGAETANPLLFPEGNPKGFQSWPVHLCVQ